MNVSSFLAFIVALTAYWITADPSVSYWDCPEYVTVASTLQIGHPPGNPVWTLAMRVLTIPFPIEYHPRVINMASGLCMAGAVFFLARIIFILTMRVCGNRKTKGNKLSETDTAVISGASSLGGSLCFAFCDSTWFSAVEAEVYAMSALFTSLTIWLALKWAFSASPAKRSRIVILLAYLTGLTLGIHQLNLLVLPACALIILYGSHPERLQWWKPWLAILISFAVIIIVLAGVMGGFVECAAACDLFLANRLGMPYWSGATALLVLSLAFLTAAAVSIRNRAVSTAAWCLAFLLLGFSAFAVIPIRAAAMPPMNQGAPADIFAFQRYLSRKQYGSKPLLYGATPYSEPMKVESPVPGSPPSYSLFALGKEAPRLVPFLPGAHLHHRSRFVSHNDSTRNSAVAEKNHGFVLSDYAFSRRTSPELDMWFPRITSSNPSDIVSYADWAGMDKENMLQVEISNVIDSLGNPNGRIGIDGKREKPISYKPTFAQNLQFLFSYQIGYMYFRYLLWNFMGRQNDIPSGGEIDHGNFITGIPYIDTMMVGEQTLMPPSASSGNPGRNVLYGIPLIFGIVGIVFLCRGGRIPRRTNAVITILFLMTGLAIVVYLNQSPGEPRERDYSFLGSYMAFSIWIAFGFTALSLASMRIIRCNLLRTVATIIPAMTLPAFMATVNLDDHDRSGRYETLAFARNILESTPPGIIFTQGDNFTFPLWYASTLPGGDRHAAIIDVSYLATPEYVISLMNQGKDKLPFIATPADIAYGAFAFTRVAKDADPIPVPLPVAMKALYASKSGLPLFRHAFAKIPGRNQGDSIVLNLRTLAVGGNIPFRQLMLLDITAANMLREKPLPLNFLTSLSPGFYLPLREASFNLPHSLTYWPGTQESRILEFATSALPRAEANIPAEKPAYIEPVVAYQHARQRGALLRLAKIQTETGNFKEASRTIEAAQRLLPWDDAPPHSFIMVDSAFNDGLEAERLLELLADSLKNPVLKLQAEEIRNRMAREARQWNCYRLSLPPSRRHALSPDTRRKIQN